MIRKHINGSNDSHAWKIDAILGHSLGNSALKTLGG